LSIDENNFYFYFLSNIKYIWYQRSKMTINDERAILMHLMSALYDYTQVSPSARFPLDSPDWLLTYEGLGVSGDYVLEEKIKDVLRIACEKFPTYKFRLWYPEEEQIEGSRAIGPYKVYLAYTKTIWPEEQE
jgi:hypothetical protein